MWSLHSPTCIKSYNLPNETAIADQLNVFLAERRLPKACTCSPHQLYKFSKHFGIITAGVNAFTEIQSYIFASFMYEFRLSVSNYAKCFFIC